MRRLLTGLLCIAVTWLAGCRSARFRVEEARLGPAPDSSRASIRLEAIPGSALSRDGCHIAYVLGEGDSSHGGVRKGPLQPQKGAVVVDGVVGPQYDQIPARPVMSSDGTHVAYVAGKGDLTNRRWLVVVDGREGPPYDAVKDESLVFSPDGKRVAYVASRGGQIGRQWFVVVDGREGPPCDEVGAPVFSPDGERVAYAALTRDYAARKGDTWAVVVDGVRGPGYASTTRVVFSANGKRFGYVGGCVRWGEGRETGGATGVLRTEAVVVDGREGPPYDAVQHESLVFSPDGQRVAYVAVRGREYRLVVDGVAGPACDFLSRPVFSPDGTRLAYAVSKGGKHSVVVEGPKRVEYPYHPADNSGYPPSFLPDGKRVVYSYNVKGGVAMAEDGVDLPPGLMLTTCSPDGKRTARVVRKQSTPHKVEHGWGGPWRGEAVVLDGVEGPTYAEARLPVFSPDGKHVAYVVARREWRRWVRRCVEDGAEGPAYDEIGRVGPTFHPDGVLEYLAAKHGTLYRVKHIPTP